MHGLLPFESIPFSQIDWQDTSYTLSPNLDEPLSDSFVTAITRIGAILHPPILQKQSQRPYRIISGRKRLLAGREILKLHACPSLILPQDIDEEKLFTILLADALSNRSLSPIEQAIFLNKAQATLDDTRVAHLFLPSLGLSPHSSQLRKALILLDLEGPLQDGLHRGLLDEKTARELLTLSFRDRMVLFELIEELQLSKSNQRKLTRSCKELASRSRATITDLLATPEIRDVLNHPDTNAPQKSAKLMTLLQDMRLPRYSEAEKNFRQFISGLDLPKGSQLTHSPFFEKDILTLTMTFADREIFLKSWPTIRSATKNTT